MLSGDKFMPQIHLRRSGFTYSACGPFTKSKNGIQKFKETDIFIKTNCNPSQNVSDKL